MLKPLFPDQAEALEAIRAELKAGRKRPVLAAPTGSGKTIMAAHMITGALAKGKRVAFTVPMINLVDQTMERLVENGIDPNLIGVIQADHEWKRAQAPIQIVSVQTAAKRGFPQVDFAIIDEAHIQYEHVNKWIIDNPEMIFIGLSATPWAEGMAEIWTGLIQRATIRSLIDLGRLSDFETFHFKKRDMSGVKITAGDYNLNALSKFMRNQEIIGDVVATWVERANGKRTLLFAVDRAHASELHDEFQKINVRSVYVDAFTPREERTQIARDFEGGEIDIICSIGTMTTGVDLPSCECIDWARPTKSDMLFCQSIGRGLRTNDGKDKLLILDHTNTSRELGTVDTILYSELLPARKKGERKAPAKADRPLPTECPECTCLIPVTVRECPSCGFELKRQSHVITAEGDLVLLDREGKPERPAKPVGKAIDRLRKMPRTDLFQMIIGYGRGLRKPRSDGWAANAYREIHECWPNRIAKTAKEPTPEVASYLRSRDIAYAMGRRKSSVSEPVDA